MYCEAISSDSLDQSNDDLLFYYTLRPATGRDPAARGRITGFHWSNHNIDRSLADKGRIQVLVALTDRAGR